MRRVLLGFKRHMVPVPRWLFRRAVTRETRRTRRAIGGATLDDEERRIHHFVVRELPRLARAMPPEFVSERLGIEVGRVAEIFDALERRLVYVFRPGGRDVEWAYPITVEATPHHLAFSSGERLYAA